MENGHEEWRYTPVRWKHTKKRGWHWKGLKERVWTGKYKVNKKAVESRVEEVWRKKRAKVPKTPKGGIRSNYEVLKDCGDEVLEAYARYQKAGSLKAAIEAYKNPPIRARFDSLQLTGRTSCSNPNLQNIRREPGARECFIPRPGYIFAAADYSSLELHTLAQICVSWLGYSALAEALNKGQDAHLKMGADMLNISYEEAVKRKKHLSLADASKAFYKKAYKHLDQEKRKGFIHEITEDLLRKVSLEFEIKHFRQLAKVANFGFPGGLGPVSLVDYAKALYGVVLTKKEAINLKEKWLASWPEMEDYFKLANSRLKDEITITLEDGEKKKVKAGFVEQLFVGRFRGRCTYCKICNTPFQGLGADGAKEAGWRLTRASYSPSHVLYGCRLVNFIHDEFLMEIPDDDKKEERALALSKIMCEGMNVYLPDCPVRAEPVLMNCWMKDAEGLYNKEGKVIVHGT